MRPLRNPVFIACLTFSEPVTHSRLPTVLSVFSPLMWFTWRFLFKFCRNETATNRWTLNVLCLPSDHRFTTGYPHRSSLVVNIFSGIFCFTPLHLQTILFKDFMRPKLDTSYSPS